MHSLWESSTERFTSSKEFTAKIPSSSSNKACRLNLTLKRWQSPFSSALSETHHHLPLFSLQLNELSIFVVIWVEISCHWSINMYEEVKMFKGYHRPSVTCGPHFEWAGLLFDMFSFNIQYSCVFWSINISLLSCHETKIQFNNNASKILLQPFVYIHKSRVPSTTEGAEDWVKTRGCCRLDKYNNVFDGVCEILTLFSISGCAGL